ncbi:unnamed protein product [Camellia sinensis]
MRKSSAVNERQRTLVDSVVYLVNAYDKERFAEPKRSWMPSSQTIHLQMSRFSYLGTRLTYPMLPQRMS